MRKSPESGDGTAHSGQHARNVLQAGSLPTEKPNVFRSRSTRPASHGTATIVDTAAADILTQFLEARGLDVELAARMGWLVAKAKDGKAWIKIPYWRNGEIINHKYRSVEGKEFRNDPGAEHDLWNVDCLKDETLMDQPLIITEGEMDALAVMQCGFPRVVSIPDGWTKGLEDESGQAKFSVFNRNRRAIEKCGTVIVAADNDDTGKSLTRAVANSFAKQDVRYVRWPDGCKDANDTLKISAEYVEQAIIEARRIDPPGGMITGFSDLPPRPDMVMWKLGVVPLDSLIAFRTRELAVLTGKPGAGKTTFTIWCMWHLVRRYDIRVGMALFETDPEIIFRHLCRLKYGMESQRMDAAGKAKERRELDRNFRLLHRVDEGTSAHNIDWLEQSIHKLAARDQCNLVCVDPWNELEHMPEPGEPMTYYANWVLMEMRKWAEKYDIHILLTAHPRKMRKEDGIPGGYDIDGSAAFANKPAMGYAISLSDSEDSNANVIFNTWKVRDRPGTGCDPGVAYLYFDPQAMVYRSTR